MHKSGVLASENFQMLPLNFGPALTQTNDASGDGSFDQANSAKVDQRIVSKITVINQILKQQFVTILL